MKKVERAGEGAGALVLADGVGVEQEGLQRRREREEVAAQRALGRRHRAEQLGGRADDDRGGCRRVGFFGRRRVVVGGVVELHGSGPVGIVSLVYKRPRGAAK